MRVAALHSPGLLGEALRANELAICIGPTGADARNGRASALAGLGRRREAAAEWATALRLDPNQAYSAVRLALGV